MRRIGCFIIALLMIFSYSYLISSAQEDTVDDYAEEMGLLITLGVQSFYHEQEVTRGEFLKAVLKIIFDGDFSTGKLKFTDLSEEQDRQIGASVALELGFISYGDGNFYPSRTITVAEASKILVDATGHGVKAAARGGYPVGYMTTAKEIGIFKGVNVSSADKVTGKVAVKLLVNLCDAEVLEPVSYGESQTLKQYKNNTVLYKYKGIIKESGIVTATEITRLYSPVGLSKHRVMIDDVEYYDEQGLVLDLIGRQVTFYYKSDDGKNNILYAFAPNEKNDITEVSSDRIAGVTGRKFSYYEGNKERINVIHIPIDVKVIYNGKAKLDYDPSTFKPLIGSVTFIDNDSNGEVDVAIVREYENIFVGAIDKENSIVYDYYSSKTKNVNFEKQDRKTVILKNFLGVDMEVFNIEIGNVITVLRSNDNNYICATVSKEFVRGEIVSIAVEEEGDIIALASGDQYRLAKDFPKYVLKVGDRGTFYKNIDGTISGFLADTSMDFYACILKASVTSGVDKKLQLMAVKEDGNREILTVSSKVFIDGYKYDNSEEAFGALPDSFPFLIKYSYNLQGEVSVIDTEAENRDRTDHDFYCFYSDYQQLTYYRGHTFNGVYETSGTSVVFYVPNKASYELEDCLVDNRRYLSDYRKYSVKAYARNASDAVVPDFFIVKIDETQYIETCLLVIDIIKTIDAGGFPVKRIRVAETGGAIYEYICEDESILSNVKPGDIIKYALSFDRTKITRAAVIYSAEERRVVDDNLAGTSRTFFSNYHLVIGEVAVKKNNIIGVKKNPNSNNLEYYLIGDRVTFVVDSKYKNRNAEMYVLRGGVDDILDAARHGEGSHVVVINHNGEAFMVVVYK